MKYGNRSLVCNLLQVTMLRGQAVLPERRIHRVCVRVERHKRGLDGDLAKTAGFGSSRTKHEIQQGEQNNAEHKTLRTKMD